MKVLPSSFYLNGNSRGFYLDSVRSLIEVRNSLNTEHNCNTVIRVINIFLMVTQGFRPSSEKLSAREKHLCHARPITSRVFFFRRLCNHVKVKLRSRDCTERIGRTS